MLAESLNLDQNDDIVTRSFTALGRSCALYFVEGMASGQRMSDSVLRPLLRAQEELSGRQALEAVTRRLIEAPEVKTEKQPYAAVQQLMRGQTLVLIDTVDEARAGGPAPGTSAVPSPFRRRKTWSSARMKPSPNRCATT